MRTYELNRKTYKDVKKMDHAGNPRGKRHRGKESKRHSAGVKFGKGKEGVNKWIKTRYICKCQSLPVKMFQ